MSSAPTDEEPALAGGSPPAAAQPLAETKRGRRPLHLLSLETAVRLLCSRAVNPLSPISDSDRAALLSYAHEGFG